MFTKYFLLTITFTVVALLTVNFTVAENSSKTVTNKKIKNLSNTTIARSDGRLTQIVESPKNSFSMWLSRVWNWLISSTSSESISESRTFGHIRRLKNALIPIMFKFGVISTLIMVLVFLALKTILLLKAILILNAGAILAKLIALKTSSGHDHHHYVSPPVWQPPPWSHGHHGHFNSFGTPYNNYNNGPPSQPWASTVGQGKEIHVHIHNSGTETKPSYPQHQHHSSSPIINSNSIGWDSEPYVGYSDIQKQYVVNPIEQQQPHQQQQLVKIHRDDQLNYVNSRRYGKSLKE